MAWLTGNWVHLGVVAGKAALMYVTALVALRMGERRTLSKWTLIDFVAAVAVGAVVGRTAIASSQSFITGAVALVVLVVCHRVASLLRFSPVFGRMMDHRIRVLLVDGRIRERQLRLCGLTRGDLFSHLRRQGVFALSGVRLVLYEARGDLTVVLQDARGRVSQEPELIDAALREAVDHGPDE
jgi:uncharacterized membrane protein YcaP (DUF421 family)